MAAAFKFVIEVVLGWALKNVWPLIVKWAQTAISKFQRGRKQKETGDQVQKDIDEKKPRDEETRKHEEEGLNS